jgi:hypothetical protein
MKIKLLLLLPLLAIAGCLATPYAKVSAMNPNGYSEVMLDSTRAAITFTSFRADRDEAVIKGALLRAAELAKENGFDTFAIISDSNTEQTSSIQTGGTYQATRVGNQTFGSFSPGMPLVLVRAQQRITVQFFQKRNAPPGAFDVEDVIKRNRPSFQ